jgi:hypothetical protein
LVVKFPVELDNGMVITGNEKPFNFGDGIKLNGLDSDGDRITNVVGFNGTELMKCCPNCQDVFPSSEFGEIGRPNHIR